jgi:hypothetical protein
MGDLSGCYSWEATFTPPPSCGTSSGAAPCPDATWFWLLAAFAAGVVIVKRNS